MKKLLLIALLALSFTSCSSEDSTKYPTYGPNTQYVITDSFTFTSVKSVYLTDSVGEYKDTIRWSYDRNAHKLTELHFAYGSGETVDVTDNMDGKLVFTSQEGGSTYTETYDCSKIEKDTLVVSSFDGKINGKALYIR